MKNKENIENCNEVKNDNLNEDKNCTIEDIKNILNGLNIGVIVTNIMEDKKH